MDESIERLARAAASDPSDEAAARRLDAELLRHGRRDEASARFRFKFQCSRQWFELRATDRPGMKFCEGCRREVHAVSDVESLREQVSLGHCVAFPASRLGHAFEGLAGDHRVHSGREAKPPCVVAGGAVPTTALAELAIPRSMAARLRAVPVGTRGSSILVAAVRHDPIAVEELERALGREVETVLATEEEVAGLVATLPEVPPFAWEAEGDVLMGDIAAVEPPAPRIDETIERARDLVRATEYAAAARELAACIARERLDPRTAASLLTAEARARALAGEPAGARGALERALATDPGYIYAALWLAALFGEIGPLAHHVRRHAWPAPVARWLVHEIALDRLIADAAAAADDKERRERLCEAHCFVGVELETRGSLAEAQAHYQRCLEQRVGEFVETDWANERVAEPGPPAWSSRTPGG